MISNGTKVAFKFRLGFGAIEGGYIEGEGIVEDFGFSMNTGRENTYMIRTDDNRLMHVLSCNVRKAA